MKKWTKYHSKKVTVEGITFDSTKEYHRWQELVKLQDAGEIHELQRQVKFSLIPLQREPDTVGARGGVKKGKVIERAVDYIADFTYLDANGNLVVEDTKGFKTADYILKRKLLLWVHGIRVREI